MMAGFGGVAEYGITVRWNKNYLKLVRLLLERRERFAAFGGVRFGGGATVTIDDALAMGFDHVALCMGAGKPTVLDIPNGLARGVRAASDFLMALQLTGAAKRSSDRQSATAPAGGGHRRRADRDRHRDREPRLLRPPGRELCRPLPHAARRARRDGGARSAGPRRNAEIADEFLAHAAAIAAERAAAAAAGRAPRLARCWIAGAAPRSPIAAG